MPLKIEIDVPDHFYDGRAVEKRSYLDETLGALGFSRTATAPAALGYPVVSMPDLSVLSTDKTQTTDDTPATPEPEQAAAPAAEEPKRRGRKPKGDTAPAAEQPQISTGGERVGPEDDAETAAQDAADEAAEVEASRDAKAPLTHDDVRQASARYIKKFGIAAAQKDVPAILGCALVDVPDTQEALAEAIAKLTAAAAEDKPAAPAEPEASAFDEPAAPKTRADVLAACRQYALKFEGTDQLSPATTPHTDADLKQVLTMLFGAGTTKLGQVEDKPENWAKIESGMLEALAKDPFKRGAK